jgi:hypothetical protein
MQCYYCGAHIPHGIKMCPHCGNVRSRLIYVHLWGVIGGITGCLIGFTLSNVGWGLLGGLLGILVFDGAAKLLLRSRTR